MVPTLLILTDFLAGANRALDFATNLAQPLGAQLVLLHVHRDSLLDPERLTGKLTGEGKEIVDLALDSLIHHLPVPAMAEIGNGRVETVVPEAIERHQPMVVVLSRPEEAATPDEFVMTTALKLLRLSTCPLLIVPPQAPKTTLPQHVMLAADGGAFKLAACTERIQNLLQALGMRLTVVHVTESATRHTAPQALASVVDSGLTRDLPTVTTYHMCSAEPADGVLTAIGEQHPDLLAVVARPRSFLGALFHRSVTAQLVLHSPIPVLVLPAQPDVHEPARRQAAHQSRLVAL